MKTTHFHWITTATAVLAMVAAASTWALAPSGSLPPAQARAETPASLPAMPAPVRPATT